MAKSHKLNAKSHKINGNTHAIFKIALALEMATAQRTRPRAVVGAPRRAAWQLKSALRHSISAAPRTKIFLHFFYNYCW